MTRDEAKLALQALRPNDRDAAHPLFTQALALVERDPELQIWWEAQQNFDRKVSAKLGELPLPAHLRATILAGQNKIVPFPAPSPFRLPYWLAAAAVLVFFLVAGFHFLGHAPAMARQDYVASILPYLGQDDPALGMTSGERDKIMAWLQQRNAPTGSLPGGMSSLPSIGCQKLAIHGHTVSLICFSLAGGGLVHLFVVDRQALNDPPGSSPEFKLSGDWSTASWSDGTRSYVLATRAGPDTLKQLL